MELFERLVSVLSPIFLIVFVGYLYAKKRAPDLEHSNKVNIEVFTPMLIFSVLSQGNIALSQYGALAMAAVLVVLVPGLLTIPLAKKLGVANLTFVPPMMFRNSGNLGLPLFLLAFGEEMLPAAVILFIVENTLHFSLGMRLLNTQQSWFALLRIPMLQATFLGLVFAMFSWRLPEPIQLSIDMLGQVAIPLMLFSLGARMSQAKHMDWNLGLVSAIWAPVSGLLVALPVAYLFGLEGAQLSMLLIFSALPPAVLNFLVAERYGQEPEKVASIVLAGNMVSALTLPVILAFVL